MLEYPDECKGCTLLDSDERYGCVQFQILKRIFKNCPCLDCIVKVTCTDQCENFTNFQEDFII